MSSMKRLFTLPCVAGCLAVGAIGCDGGDNTAPSEKGAPPPTVSAPASAEAVLAGVMLASAPAEAKDLSALKGSAKEGAEVTFRGRVGGRAEPFVDGRAAFQVVDLAVKSCKEIPGDTCETPWDYCCEPDVTKSSATVQVVDADGKPLKVGLKGVGGLQPLAEVTVNGKLGKTQEGAPLVVNATGIHVKS